MKKIMTKHQPLPPPKDDHAGWSVQLPQTEPGSKDALIELLRTSARKLIALALQAELSEFLAIYTSQRDSQGYALVVRNGHQPQRDIQTIIGPVAVTLPKVRSRQGKAVTFRSTLIPRYLRKARSFEGGGHWQYVQGISTRNAQMALDGLFGQRAKGLSPHMLAQLQLAWREEPSINRQRFLGNERWINIWAAGIHPDSHVKLPQRSALVVIGMNAHGDKQILAIESGLLESTHSWHKVLLGLKIRGLNAPTVAIGEQNIGLWAALQKIYPSTKQQRC